MGYYKGGKNYGAARRRNCADIGCTITLFCTTDGERQTYVIVKNRDSVEYKPRFAGGFVDGKRYYYERVSTPSEYGENELAADRPLALAVIGKVKGEKFTLNGLEYVLEEITFPAPRDKAASEKPAELRLNPDFVKSCTSDELEIIREIGEWVLREHTFLYADCKKNRLCFYDPAVKDYDGVQLSWFWFVRTDGVLTFRYKPKQNDDASKFLNNVLHVNKFTVEEIKKIINAITL